jgi:hypothetical protein
MSTGPQGESGAEVVSDAGHRDAGLRQRRRLRSSADRRDATACATGEERFEPGDLARPVGAIGFVDHDHRPALHCRPVGRAQSALPGGPPAELVDDSPPLGCVDPDSTIEVRQPPGPRPRGHGLRREQQREVDDAGWVQHRQLRHQPAEQRRHDRRRAGHAERAGAQIDDGRHIVHPPGRFASGAGAQLQGRCVIGGAQAHRQQIRITAAALPDPLGGRGGH